MPWGYSQNLWEDSRQWAIAHLPLALRLFPRQKMPTEVGILMYHRIAASVPGVSFPSSNVTPTTFRRQLSGLLRRGYQPWPLRRVLAAAKHGEPIPPKVFVVTFDDGYANNFTQALPILRELNVPATIFVATAFLDSDQPFPFEDWDAVRESRVPVDHWRPLTMDECRTLARTEGIELGAHTHTHRDFRGQPAEFAHDLTTCVTFLQTEFSCHEVPFAFPFGKKANGFSGTELVAAAKQTGVTCGLTSENELTKSNSDPFTWGRLTAAEYDSPLTLSAKIDGVYGLARQWWRRWSNFRTSSRKLPLQ